MRPTLRPIYVVAICCCAVAATEKTSAEKDGLFGPVRIVREERVELSKKDGEWVEGARDLIHAKIYDASGVLEADISPGHAAEFKRYDRDGKLIERVRYHKNGSLEDKAVYTYDRDGKVSEVRHYHRNGNQSRKVVYTYDAGGKVSEIHHYNIHGDLSRKERYTYDKQGQPTKEVTYNVLRSSIESKTTYVYTDDTTRIVEFQAEPDGSLYKKRVEELHLQERKTATTEYYPDGSMKKNKYVAYHDSRGNEIKRVRFYEGSVVGQCLSTYDGSSNLIEITDERKDGSVENRQEFEYDPKGSLVQYDDTEFDEDGSVEWRQSNRYEYELDGRGNWVTRTTISQCTEADGSRSEEMTKWYRTIVYADDAKLSEALRTNRRLFRDKFSIPKPRLRLDASVYRDKEYAEPMRYFDRSAKTLTDTVYYQIRCSDLQGGVAASIAGGFYDPSGKLTQSATGRTTNDGWYRGSYTLKDDDEPGVWWLKVGCEHADYRGTSGRTPFHVYPGTGVSSYQFCLGTSGKGTHLVLENKHLIAVFGGGLPCTKVLRYLYQKDTKTTYTFGKTNIGRFDYIYNRFEGYGEITSNQSVERRYSPRLSQQSENLPGGSLELAVRLVYPLNEFIDPMFKNISIWKKIASSPLDYEKVYTYDSPDETEWDAMDHAVGDTDHDGLNELVIATGWDTDGRLLIFENASGSYDLTWKSGNILKNKARVDIADVDHDGLEEIVACGESSIYVFEYNGSGYENVTYHYIGQSTKTLEVKDFDGDGEYEILVVDNSDQLNVLEYDGSSYELTQYQIPLEGYVNPDSSGSGDIDRDGLPEFICSSGLSEKFIIIDYVNGSYTKAYEELIDNSYAMSCAIADGDNEGQMEVIIGTRELIMFYEYLGSWQFENTWNGSANVTLANTLQSRDADSDGLHDILFTGKTDTEPYFDQNIYLNRTGGPPFERAWVAYKYSDDDDSVLCGAGDIDNDGHKTRFNVDVKLSSEDADWLEYRIDNLEVDPNIHTVFPILSGALGLGNDDHYRLADGQDDPVTELKPNTWTNLPSDYCLLYDESEGNDHVSTALAWVRFRESENVEFQDVGLWNDTNGKTATRIRYDVKRATPEDEFTCLLVFTRGGKDTIDRWLPTLQSGQLPKTNFMTTPD